ncbi:Inner nuclear membrane protein Man1 [Taenia crassiceps]|uniref:Inner nuclear membrane protein Man1 n=1 Tax=Taenia crassiceps TaxID=6207 RepID=A0ABR4QSU3_9CEST
MRALSDDQLREKLRANGYEPGPITPATRQVYERKLERLLKDNKPGIKTPRSDHGIKSESVKPEAGFPSRLLSRSVDRTSFLDAAHADIPKKTLELDSRHQFLNTPLRDSYITPHSQQNPGHTPTASIRSPLRTVNTDVPGASSNSTNFGLGLRQKSPVLSSSATQISYQDGGSISSGSPVSLGRGISASYNGDPSDISNPVVPSHERPFWSSWVPRSSNLGSAVISDDSSPAADVVHRAHQSENPSNCRQPLSEESFEGSFCSKMFGFSFGNQDKHSNVGRIADLQKVVCLPDERSVHGTSAVLPRPSCVSSQDIPLVLRIVHSLFEILSRFSGENICGYSVESSRMEVGIARHLVESYFANHPTASVSVHQVGALWSSVLIIITEVGQKHLQIAAYDADGQPTLNWRDVVELESLRPYIPGSCRLRLFAHSVLNFLSNLLWLLIILSAVGGFCYLIYRIKQSHQNRTKKRAMRVREIVREVSCILQQQLQHSQSNPTEPAYVPVSMIKERLRHTNPDLTELWTEVEHYVHLVEGSISVQEWRGVGETWQWQAGSGWQGSAFQGKSQNLPFTTPPTECLKVRNMFTRDSTDAPAKRRLIRELLNRVAGCGPILHIGLDSQNNQGLVYIKCASPDVAGRVFEAINANYFDSHLLTVKFLRASKYHLRFPDAHNVVTPLSAADFE